MRNREMILSFLASSPLRYKELKKLSSLSRPKSRICNHKRRLESLKDFDGDKEEEDDGGTDGDREKAENPQT